MRRLVEAVLPARMGTSFRWLIGSSWVSNLGDGIGLAAGPLLIASQTQDPLLVALGALLGRLPWLLFGLYAGALADRIDRRLMVVAVDLMRAAVLGVLAVAIVGGEVSIELVLVAMFLLGTAEVFADTATGTLLPMVVAKRGPRDRQRPAQAGSSPSTSWSARPSAPRCSPPAMAMPFVTQAVCVALGASSSRASRCRPVRAAAGRRTSATTSSRACTGGTTRRSARWC